MSQENVDFVADYCVKELSTVSSGFEIVSRKRDVKRDSKLETMVKKTAVDLDAETKMGVTMN